MQRHWLAQPHSTPDSSDVSYENPKLRKILNKIKTNKPLAFTTYMLSYMLVYTYIVTPEQALSRTFGERLLLLNASTAKPPFDDPIF